MILKEIEVEIYPDGRMDDENAAKYLKYSTNTIKSSNRGTNAVLTRY